MSEEDNTANFENLFDQDSINEFKRYADLAAEKTDVDDEDRSDKPEPKNFIQRTVGSESFGKIIAFKYDPKYKDRLLQYDTFPLVVVLSNYGSGFAGINLHFLGGNSSAISLIQEFSKNLNNDKMDISTKMMITYDMLKGMNSFGVSRQAYRRYLSNHVRSPILVVDPSKWEESIVRIQPKFNRT